MTAAGVAFRQNFQMKGAVNWFPSHMSSSFKSMQAKMKSIDCVIEVHDSRIPFSGRNPMFLRSLLGNRPHILVLNKFDLIDKSNIPNIKNKCLEDNCSNVVFTNCLDKQCKGLHGILPLVNNLLQNSLKQPLLDVKYKLLVVGIPNVGKSSFINALRNITVRKGKATRVGGEPGVTRSVMTNIKVSEKPPVYLIDTPGILEPNIKNNECGMKLALCSCVKDSIVGVIHIADFLLYWMNKTQNFRYVKQFGLGQPTDEIFPLLIKIAVDNNKVKQIRNIVSNKLEKVPNVEYSALTMISLFRTGKFGDLYLDKDFM